MTFHEARIGIKFGKLGSSKACKALAPMQINELSAGGEALRKYDSILQVGMTLIKVQETLLLNQCGYSYNNNHWVSSQIQNAIRPLVLTFQRPSYTADQTATLLGQLITRCTNLLLNSDERIAFKATMQTTFGFSTLQQFKSNTVHTTTTTRTRCTTSATDDTLRLHQLGGTYMCRYQYLYHSRN